MDLFSSKDILNISKYLKYFGGEWLVQLIMRLLKYDELNSHFASIGNLEGDEFVKAVIDIAGITYDLREDDLQKIPKEGPFITVSNHAYGALDGVLISKILPPSRPDFKILVNSLLIRLAPMRQFFIGVNPVETHKDVKPSIGGLKDAVQHLKNGHPLGIFPAGEVSTYHFERGEITDKEWQHSMIRFIKKARIPVVPIFFEGHNSLSFRLLGMIHPMLRTAKLPSELFNKKGKHIRIRIGTPVTVKEQDEFEDFQEFGRFLRTKTYAMSVPFTKKAKRYKTKGEKRETVVEPTPSELIEKEVNGLLPEYLLFRVKDNALICAPSHKLNHVLREIGRLRELTYREVGEGTGRGIDLDNYDTYFEQLFIWDETGKKIVGGYRVGKGKDIITEHGMEGFYIHSLFRIDERFRPVMEVSIELGRSFIQKEYQRKVLSLFLLWKGILYYLLKNPEYRYLIGPVSISNEFLDVSKGITVEFLRSYHYNSEFAWYITPRKEFIYKMPKAIDREVFIKHMGKDIGRLDRFIQDIEPSFKTPILLKKYISLNTEVIGFNVDPKFSNCLDVLIILDLFEVPYDTIESLSKEINDHSILDRFKK